MRAVYMWKMFCCQKFLPYNFVFLFMKSFLFGFLALMILTGVGCYNCVLPVQQKKLTSIQTYSWDTYNRNLKKNITVYFRYPDNYSVIHINSPLHENDLDRIIVKGSNGRVEISNQNYDYYEGVPTPENPTAEELKKMDTQLPAVSVIKGYDGDLSVYGFYSKNDSQTKADVEIIINSIAATALSAKK